MPHPVNNIAVAPPKPVKAEIKPPQETRPQAEDFDQHLESAAKKDQPVENAPPARKKPAAPKADKPAEPVEGEAVDHAVPVEGEAPAEAEPLLLQGEVDEGAPVVLTEEKEAELPELKDQPIDPQTVAPLVVAPTPVNPVDPVAQPIAVEESPEHRPQPVQATAPKTDLPQAVENVNLPAAPVKAAETKPTTASAPKPVVTPLGTDVEPPGEQAEPLQAKQSPAALAATPPQVPEQDTPTAPAPEKPKPGEVLERTPTEPPPIKSDSATGVSKPPLPAAPPPTPEVRFAHDNHEQIVQNVRTQLLPQGGAMQIRLDPPELGALQVMVEMRDGVMNATFQTSNEEATRLLSHSLNQLKHVLETQGVTVERLQVQQAPKNESSNAGDEQKQQQQNSPEDHAARQEQQRRELMRRMWRKISGAPDPLDLTA